MDKITMKARAMTEAEKREVAAAALAVFRPLHPECAIRIVVEDETDERGLPRYAVEVNPRAQRRTSSLGRRRAIARVES
jgi:hypothetical protein